MVQYLSNKGNCFNQKNPLRGGFKFGAERKIIQHLEKNNLTNII
jgi:hypothetical protein